MKKAFALGMLCMGSAVCFAEDAAYHFEGDITAHMREVAAKYPAWLTYAYDGVSYFRDSSHEDKLFDGIVESANQENERFIVENWKDKSLRYVIDQHYRAGADIIVTRYEFVAASSSYQRAPKTWTLEGSNDGETWTEIDSRSDIATATAKLAVMSYDVPEANRASYRHYRFVITAKGNPPGQPNDQHLSMQELRLFGTIDGGRGLNFDDCEFSEFDKVLTGNTDGTPIAAPQVTITLGGKVLEEGEDKDYAAEWSTLLPGKGTLAITGRGDLAGSATNIDYVVQMDITKYMRDRFPAWVNWAAPGKGFYTYTGGILLDLDHAFDGKTDANDAERCLFDKTKCDGNTMLPIDIRYSIPNSFRRGGSLHLVSYQITGIGGNVGVAPTRQFKDWELYGSNDGTHWSLVDAHTGGGIKLAPNPVTFMIPEDKRGDYRRFRLHVIANGGASDYTGVQEIQYFGYFEGGVEPTGAPTFEDWQIDPIPDCGYTGLAVEPTFSVSFGEQVLDASNYEASYENNVEFGENAKAVATGKGLYSGTISRNFVITSREVDLTDAARKQLSACSFDLTGGTKYYPRKDAEDVDSLVNLFDGVTDLDGTARCLIEFTPDESGSCAFTNNPISITYKFERKFMKGCQIVLTGYEFVLQGTSQYWHPGSWTLSGSRDGKSWEVLDVQENAIAAGSRGGETVRFAIDESKQTPYRYYRLTVTKTSAYDKLWKMNMLGLREMRLLGKAVPHSSGLLILLW